MTRLRHLIAAFEDMDKATDAERVVIPLLLLGLILAAGMSGGPSA